jgi:hypothetical protein
MVENPRPSTMHSDSPSVPSTVPIPRRPQRHLRILLLLLAIAFSARCATVAHGTTQSIQVESNPPGAAVSLSCVQGSVPNYGSTPVTIEVQRKSKSCAISLQKDGYVPVTVPLHRTFSGVYVGNLLVGGVVGLVADAASGAMYKQGPNVVRVDLPVRSSPPVVTVPASSEAPAPSVAAIAPTESEAPPAADPPPSEAPAEASVVPPETPPVASAPDTEPQTSPPAASAASGTDPMSQRRILMDRRGRDVAWVASDESELSRCTELGTYEVGQAGSDRPEAVADEVVRVGGDTVFKRNGGTRFDIYRCGAAGEQTP